MIHRLLAITLLAGVAFAQPDSRLRFEVAEVSVSKPDIQPNIDLRNGQLRLTAITMRRMIAMAYAYSIREDDLRGGPAWLDSDRFDVIAKSAGASEPTVFGMLQTLLADRFRLKTHSEEESRLVYELSVAAAGSSLQSTAPGEPAACTSSVAGPERIHLACTNTTMVSFARRLPFLTNLDLPLIDLTELKGAYDFGLDWRWEAPLDPAGQQNRPVAGGLDASLKRLGLLIERRKHPMLVLVIDSVERRPIE